jgi:MFS family permease
MLRSILGFLAGLATSWLTISVSQLLSARSYPPPPGADLRDPEALAAFIAAAPIPAMVLVVAGYALAALLGGWVAAMISRRHRAIVAVLVGALVLVGVILNYMLIPHPVWMVVAGVLLPVPMAWLGARMASRPGRRG